MDKLEFRFITRILCTPRLVCRFDRLASCDLKAKEAARSLSDNLIFPSRKELEKAALSQIGRWSIIRCYCGLLLNDDAGPSSIIFHNNSARRARGTSMLLLKSSVCREPRSEIGFGRNARLREGDCTSFYFIPWPIRQNLADVYPTLRVALESVLCVCVWEWVIE